MLFQVTKNPKFTDLQVNVPVWTQTSQRICVKVSHPTQPNTVYFDTDPIVEGKKTFEIKVPHSPAMLKLEVFNEDYGHNDRDNTFKVGNITTQRLIPNIYALGIMSKTARDFAVFNDEFAENAGVLSAQNAVWYSDDGKFRIDYKWVIRDDKGNELHTPARVNEGTKIIEIAKKYYMNFTVPGRKAINWHEFSHVFKNENPANEFEADKNAAFMYLGTGNPKADFYNVFFKVFYNSPSKLNTRRYNYLNAYVDNFDNMMKQSVIA